MGNGPDKSDIASPACGRAPSIANDEVRTRFNRLTNHSALWLHSWFASIDVLV
jgi:hypothetical protein